MRNVIGLSILTLSIVSALQSCAWYSPCAIAPDCSYTYFPRNYYEYQSYPLYNPYYPYGYPYYVDRPLFWRTQKSIFGGYSTKGNYWHTQYFVNPH